jgi:predicted RNA methylase
MPPTLASKVAEWAGCAGEHVLDIGCGEGALSLAALYHGATAFTLVDIDEVSLETARHLFLSTGKGFFFQALRADVFAPLPKWVEGHPTLVLMNPPYEDGAVIPFTLRALELAPRVVVIARPGDFERVSAEQKFDFWRRARLTREARCLRRPSFGKKTAGMLPTVVYEFVPASIPVLRHHVEVTIWADKWGTK